MEYLPGVLALELNLVSVVERPLPDYGLFNDPPRDWATKLTPPSAR